MRRRPIILLAAVVLTTCGQGKPIGTFAGTQPAFDAVAFWTGHHRSWGVIENRGGAPTDTVMTDCVGTPEPDGSLHMVQTLTLGDGTTQHRDWHLRRLPRHPQADDVAATANDMVGQAHGQAAGRAFHWSWVLALSPGNALKNVVMDQWMYLQADGSMMNHTTIRKFGIVVAQVSEVFTAVH